MFVFLLIVGELAVLYTVFWYLYVREPKVNRRISGDLWGMYEGFEPGRVDYTLPQVQQGSFPDGVGQSAYTRQYILDTTTNHYVPVPENAGVFAQVSTQLDRTLSQLNVKP